MRASKAFAAGGDVHEDEVAAGVDGIPDQLEEAGLFVGGELSGERVCTMDDVRPLGGDAVGFAVVGEGEGCGFEEFGFAEAVEVGVVLHAAGDGFGVFGTEVTGGPSLR